MAPILNHELLPDNDCFGCGGRNPRGLHVEVVRDPESDERLLARFTPSTQMAGFPGITHGGAIYTALDCLSTWVSTLLGPNRAAGWLLRSATTTYHKPAPAGEPLLLRGWVKQRAGAWDPIVVATEARRPDDALCVEAEFKVVPLAQDKLVRVAGLAELPDNWKFFLGGSEGVQS